METVEIKVVRRNMPISEFYPKNLSIEDGKIAREKLIHEIDLEMDCKIKTLMFYNFKF